MIDFLYPVIFYSLLISIYLYSKGKFNIKKKEEYEKWVDTKGKKVSKSVIIIGILYTVFFIMQLIG